MGKLSKLERRLVYSGAALLVITLTVWIGAVRQVPSAYADPPLFYFGADRGTGMSLASGVSTSNAYPSHTWPQAAGNYCFLADVQAMIRYSWWHAGSDITTGFWYNRADQGPPTYSTAHGNPQLETQNQLLYEMDYYMVANFGPAPDPRPTMSSPNRRPFTMADSSHDFGGDPRAATYAIWDETTAPRFYHNYIYHNGVSGATAGFAYALTAYQEPVMEFVDGGLHSIVVAGVWAYHNPITYFPQTPESLAIYNSWDQTNWGSYLNGAYYSRVSYTDWSTRYYGSGFWWAHGYDWDHTNGGYSNYANGGLDPDPYMGIYQAGTDPVTGIQTSHPNSTHWVGNYVSIERDGHGDYSPNYTYNESDVAMGGP